MRRPTSIQSVFALASLTALLAASGCAQRKEPAPVVDPGPAISEPAQLDLAALRAEYAKVDPNVKIGLVGEVQAADSTLLVTELTDADLGLNQVVTIANAQGEKIADGVVTLRGLSGGVGVKYSNATREPALGDIVVKFAQ